MSTPPGAVHAAFSILAVVEAFIINSRAGWRLPRHWPHTPPHQQREATINDRVKTSRTRGPWGCHRIGSTRQPDIHNYEGSIKPARIATSNRPRGLAGFSRHGKEPSGQQGAAGAQPADSNRQGATQREQGGGQGQSFDLVRPVMLPIACGTACLAHKHASVVYLCAPLHSVESRKDQHEVHRRMHCRRAAEWCTHHAGKCTQEKGHFPRWSVTLY